VILVPAGTVVKGAATMGNVILNEFLLVGTVSQRVANALFQIEFRLDCSNPHK
jgi:hypothetical protein